MARKGNTIQINISIPKKLAAKIKALADAEQRSLSNWCAVALMRAAEESERK